LDVAEVKTRIDTAEREINNAANLVQQAIYMLDTAHTEIVLVRATSHDPLGLAQLNDMREQLERVIAQRGGVIDSLNNYKVNL
jgi:hypothetical protein